MEAGFCTVRRLASTKYHEPGAMQSLDRTLQDLACEKREKAFKIKSGSAVSHDRKSFDLARVPSFPSESNVDGPVEKLRNFAMEDSKNYLKKVAATKALMRGNGEPSKHTSFGAEALNEDYTLMFEDMPIVTET
uniref:Uncharacterized protein n=1 Tax=Lotharella oceanica TaxID=641309 RepID=A0A7S2TJK2_9EUKA|mmetsp:Transcript_16938/g.32103  ORF Transcript_16938/g.32103 Transcript_16938/m.32103 type:complete len:134 (+) Transcript_16938:30-431(+)